MKSNRVLVFLLILAVAAGCSGGKSGGNGSSTPPATLVSIIVTPSNPSSAAATIRQFTATGKYSNNSLRDLTTSATWRSSEAAVAAISNTAGSNGLATLLTQGTTTITAVSGSISGSTTLDVTSATLASLAITPANPTLSVDSTEQFSVLGTFSDGSTQIPLVNWSSSNTTIATIDITSGLATALAAGTTSIIAIASSGTVSNFTTLTVTPQPLNVIPITVNGSLCSPATSANYVNKPCVSVTVCTPGTLTCTTINDILLDTGSYGLRIFKSVLTGVRPAQVTTSAGALVECVQFADTSSLWGPVMTADVILGQEPPITVPIQVIDASFPTAPTGSNGCGTPDPNPSSAGFNGILGVGLFAEDCGAFCVSNAINGSYYTCTGSACVGTTVALSNQVKNPVALLPLDNNGVIVKLPAVPLGGKTSVNGSLVFGIGTRTNNTPSGVTVFPANGFGEFTTVFSGSTYTGSFIDSGSNALYFSAPPASIPFCTGTTGWYCPSSVTPLTATNKGYTGAPSNPVSFQIGNATTLFNSSNMVFSELGGSMAGLTQTFDWGLPFYFGRDVYVGLEGNPSSLGTGPYWAY